MAVNASYQNSFDAFVRSRYDYLFSEGNLDHKVIRQFFYTVKKYVDCINNTNVTLIAHCLYKFRSYENSKTVSKIKYIYIHIFSIKNDGKYFIHRFAAEGNINGVIALARLNPSQVYLRSDSKETALDFAVKCKAQGIIQYLTIFNSEPFLNFKRLNDISCTKGDPPKGLNRNESLMRALRKAGLACTHKHEYANVTYYFTNTFGYTYRFENRALIFCFVEKSKRLYPRLFWLSGSQGLWRNTDKIFKNWIGKSDRGEESLALPFKIDQVVHEIHNQTNQQSQYKNLSKELGERLLKHIIAWSIHSVGDLVLAHGLLMRKCKDNPSHLTPLAHASSEQEDYSNFSIGPSELPEDPTNNVFMEEEYTPDFSNIEHPYIIRNSGTYGDLTARICPSKNKLLSFLFLESYKYVFLAGAEFVDSEITKQGLKKKYVQLGSLALPLLEYRSQFDDRYLTSYDKAKINQRELEKKYNGYVITWNYLKKMPLIIEYYQAVYKNICPPDPSNQSPWGL
jgi:hypothetical protein